MYWHAQRSKHLVVGDPHDAPGRFGQSEARLPAEVQRLYRRSLLIIRTQCDNDGAVLAANDSDIQWGHNDHYSYMWGRDGAFVCDAVDRAGFPEITRALSSAFIGCSM